MVAGKIFMMAGMWTMWISTLKVVRVIQLGINNKCYCCLHLPISHILVSVLQSLLSDRKSSLSQNLYKMSQQIDAKLRKVGQDKPLFKIYQLIINVQQLKSLISNLLLVNSTAPTSSSLHITHSQANAIKEHLSQSSTMSSKNSFQEYSSAVHSFSSNESSTLSEDQDSTLFGLANIFQL